MIGKLCTVFLPWRLKRWALVKFYKFDLAPSARIGLAWVFPTHLVMEENTRIDHFTVAIHLDRVTLKMGARVGRGNWITGFPSGTKKHFTHQPQRTSSLYLGEQSAVTKNHHIDCTSPVHIGKFSTVAGYQSQLLTHSIDVQENRQDSHPIEIGDFCFVGTNTVLLGGSKLPDRSVLGAKSLLNKVYVEHGYLYAGQPARPIKRLEGKLKYFSRTTGFVN